MPLGGANGAAAFPGGGALRCSVLRPRAPPLGSLPLPSPQPRASSEHPERFHHDTAHLSPPGLRARSCPEDDFLPNCSETA